MEKMDELPELDSFDLSLLDDYESQDVNLSNEKAVRNFVNGDVDLSATGWLDKTFLFGIGQSRSEEKVNGGENCSDTDSVAGSSTAPSPAISKDGREFTLQPNDQELASIPVKELNAMVKRLPKDQVRDLKKRRRTLKNRGYAHSCRVKRLEEKSHLEKNNEKLKEAYRGLQRQLALVTAEKEEYRNKYDNLILKYSRPAANELEDSMCIKRPSNAAVV